MGLVMCYVFDTNILIDYLNGFSPAIDILEKCQNPKISRITWIEVMVGTNEQNKQSTEQFLALFDVIDISKDIAIKSVKIRQTKRIKLPDAIILATANHLHLPLVSRNTKDFSADDPNIIIPYIL